jgi:hypothetical protein
MPQENSVLFALRDLHGIEAQRVAEERRAEEAAKLQQERARAAEEPQRQAAAATQAREEALRRAEREAHEKDRVALDAATVRSRQLEDDVRQLQAMLETKPHRQTSRFPWLPLLAIAAAAIIAAPLLAWRHSVPQPQANGAPPTAIVTPQASVVAVPAPPVLPTSTDAPAPAPAVKAHPVHRVAKHKSLPPKPTGLKLDCKDSDPLCGAG